jgi:hypothetical protein
MRWQVGPSVSSRAIRREMQWKKNSTEVCRERSAGASQADHLDCLAYRGPAVSAYWQ